MFYETGSSWYAGDKRADEETPQEASLKTRSAETVQQSEWLGWDGWVNPEPAQTVAHVSETAV